MTGIQETSELVHLKATIELPDDLYRRVKAKSAMEGRAIRDVTAELYRQWLAESTPPTSPLGGEAWLGNRLATGREEMEAVPSIPTARILQNGLPLHAPALLRVEVGCSVARRSRSESVGGAIVVKLRSLPQLYFASMDDAFIADAVECGTRLLLRGTDAFSAAAAERTSGELVTWDGELIQRAAGITPTACLAANP